MTESLLNKHVVLGVTGSIACYKALDLASKLMQAGALVDTIMSYGATQFVTPLAFRNITHREVVTDTFDPASAFSNQHVALAQAADIVVIAPATVHCIAKLALGLADDPLTTTVVATRAPLLVAPAMDGNMYDHPATQENLAKLRQRGVVIAGPAPGRLASGLVGMGRLLETPELLGHITATLGREGDLAGPHHPGQCRRHAGADRSGASNHQQLLRQDGLRHCRSGSGPGGPGGPSDRADQPARPTAGPAGSGADGSADVRTRCWPRWRRPTS